MRTTKLAWMFATSALFFLTQPTAYSAVRTTGVLGDHNKSVVYDALTGDISLDVPDGYCATTIEIQSATDIFTGPKPAVVTGLFDVYTPRKLFLLKPPAGITGRYSIGPIMEPGIPESVLAENLTFWGGACTVDESSFRDLVYIVPEPALPSGLWLVLATLRGCGRRRSNGNATFPSPKSLHEPVAIPSALRSHQGPNNQVICSVS